MANLDQFKGTYPYASELFGVYQPLLGWKPRQGKERAAIDSRRLLGAVMRSAQRDGRLQRYSSFDPVPVSIDTPMSARLPTWIDSTVARTAQAQVNAILAKHKRPPRLEEWQQILSQDNVNKALKSAAQELNVSIKAAGLKITCGDLVFFEKDALSAEEFKVIGATEVPGTNRMVTSESRLQFQGKLQRETVAAGTLRYLLATSPNLLGKIFIGAKAPWERESVMVLEALRRAPLINGGPRFEKPLPLAVAYIRYNAGDIHFLVILLNLLEKIVLDKLPAPKLEGGTACP